MKMKKNKIGFADAEVGTEFVSDVTPPQPIAAAEQVYDETLAPMSIAKLDASSFTIENISNQLKSQSSIAQAAADKLAIMQESVPKEIKEAEIKVSKNLNPYVIALGVVVGLLIIDKLIMKDATGN
jgi:hypothetical protein